MAFTGSLTKPIRLFGILGSRPGGVFHPRPLDQIIALERFQNVSVMLTESV